MNRWVMVGFILALLVLPLITYSVNADSEQETIVVPDDYATIQAAIDSALDGSVIHVKSGIYHENLKINKSISLIGESYDSVIVDGNRSEGYRVPCRIHCSNVSVSGFTFYDGLDGIQLMSGVNDCNISGNQLINNQYGITADIGSSNIFSRNIIDSTELGYGIYLTRCSNSIIQGNYIHSSAEGIAVIDDLLSPEQVITSRNNKIIGNILVNCTERAVWFKFTKENLMVGNNITDCAVGLAILFADNNTVYQNNFFNNAQQVAGGLEPIWSGGSGTRYSICKWDNGEEGNYWSDYNGTDADKDGVGDTPYVINEANSDVFPLMNPAATQEVNNAFTSPMPSASPTPTASPPAIEPLPVGQIIAVSASVTVALFGFWLIFRKPKR